MRAEHDVVMGDQYNTIQIGSIQSACEFAQTLEKVQTQIAALKQSGELSHPVKTNLEAAETRVAAAKEEACAPQPVGESIKATLSEAKEYMHQISSSLQSAASLGTTLGGLALLALKVFGG